MSRNGAFFISIAEPGRVMRSVWDPYFYRGNGAGKRLGDYVTVAKLKRDKTINRSPFRAIEYGDISKGNGFAFTLKFLDSSASSKLPAAGEQELLMGTMRAYLGNVLVTPKAEWLGLESPLFFSVKSEFVRIIPRDECFYFWWAFLQSPAFLMNLPVGSGGTRPRLQSDALLLAPVEVPGLKTRREIHRQLCQCAKQEWKQAVRRMAILGSLNL